MARLLCLVLTLTLCLILITPPAFAKKSTFYVNKIYDYPQTELEKIIENYDRGGFCAPAAASNILKTFHSDRVNQGLMIKELAEYMQTDPNRGTLGRNFMIGIARYMDKYLGGYSSIQFQGLGENVNGYHTGEYIPDLDFITDGLGMKKGTWLMIGLFKYDPEKDVYNRVSGHLLTLVGYNVAARKNILIVNDSASFKKDGASNEYLRVEQIESGSLDYGNFKLPAKGFLKVVDGLEVQYDTESYDTVIITGVTRLERK